MTTPEMPKEIRERRDEFCLVRDHRDRGGSCASRGDDKWCATCIPFNAGHTETAKYYEKKIEGLVEALKLSLPVVEAAYWDHHSAGMVPGSGYHHNCYDKLPFNWRENKEFNDWITSTRQTLENFNENA